MINLCSIFLNPLHIRRNSCKHIGVPNSAWNSPGSNANQNILHDEGTTRVGGAKACSFPEEGADHAFDNLFIGILRSTLAITDGKRIQILKTGGKRAVLVNQSPAAENCSETIADVSRCNGNAAD